MVFFFFFLMDSSRLFSRSRHVSMPIHELDFQVKVSTVPSIPQFQDVDSISNQHQQTHSRQNSQNLHRNQYRVSSSSLSSSPSSSIAPYQQPQPHSDGWVHPLPTPSAQYQTFQQPQLETDDNQYLLTDTSFNNSSAQSSSPTKICLPVQHSAPFYNQINSKLSNCLVLSRM